ARALANEDLVIYGDGGQTRDLISVTDIAAGLLHLSTHRELEGVFNLGQGTAISVKDLAEAIRQRTGSRSRLRHEPERQGEIRHSVASIERLQATGWSPRVCLEEGLDTTVSLYRSAAHRNER
ncbi:MAG: dTDP-glucose 4,6-dehydratase, partial [Verrucomicrobia bacterium]|nr:dTDP-glucose 4,6-dehydratase [Verrucomicrobiota bacterium]